MCLDVHTQRSEIELTQTTNQKQRSRCITNFGLTKTDTVDTINNTFDQRNDHETKPAATARPASDCYSIKKPQLPYRASVRYVVQAIYSVSQTSPPKRDG